MLKLVPVSVVLGVQRNQNSAFSTVCPNRSEEGELMEPGSQGELPEGMGLALGHKNEAGLNKADRFGLKLTPKDPTASSMFPASVHMTEPGSCGPPLGGNDSASTRVLLMNLPLQTRTCKP